MRLFISGYSVGETYTIGMYDLGVEGKEKKLLWSSNVENPSYLTYHDNKKTCITGRGNNVCMFMEDGDGYRLADTRALKETDYAILPTCQTIGLCGQLLRKQYILHGVDKQGLGTPQYAGRVEKPRKTTRPIAPFWIGREKGLFCQHSP